MNKFFKFFQYAYLLIAVVFIITGFMEYNSSPSGAYLLWFMAAMAIGMFFFKRHFRRKFEQRNKK